MADNLYCETPQRRPEQFWVEPASAQTYNDVHATNLRQGRSWPVTLHVDPPIHELGLAANWPALPKFGGFISSLSIHRGIPKEGYPPDIPGRIINGIRNEVNEMYQQTSSIQQITDNLDRDRVLICSMDRTTAYISRARALNFHTDFDTVTYDRLMTSLLAVIEYVVNTSFDPMSHGLTYEQVMTELSPERIIISCGETMPRDIFDVVQVLVGVPQYNVCLEYVPAGQEVYMSYPAFVQGLAYEYMQDLQQRALITNDPVGLNLILNYQVRSVNVEMGRVSLVVHTGFV